MPTVPVKGQLKKISVAKKYVKGLEVESRIYFTGSIFSYVCIMVSLFG